MNKLLVKNRQVSVLIVSVLVLFSGCFVKNGARQRNTPQSSIEIKEMAWGGETSRITGKIIDAESGEVLIGAEITLNNRQGAPIGCISDVDGNFIFPEVYPDYYELMVRYMGYERFKKDVKIEVGKAFEFVVKLVEERIQIEKPVIYLYPTEKTRVIVELDYQGKITHSYPKFTEKGWHIDAEPDGTLHDSNGKEYYALFWEGIPDKRIVPSNGFIVSGEETIPFLEEKLSYLGLSPREANEFIMHWLPRLEGNPYNLIHFSGLEYEQLAKLKISPKPQTLIRVMMLTQPLKSKIDFPTQNLEVLHKVRKGFTVVEWGGAEVHVINEES